MLRYDETLPIVAHRAELVAALRDHQVVVVAGETGSGKSTQLPKLCLEAGRGQHGLIGQTQPRRIAARSVAERLAEELGTQVGRQVGYQVRFTNRTSPHTRVKVMTDGVLLAEIAHDRALRAYDTIIIDEAHERSLTIDFLLGYLTLLLPQRPDLHLVITSATIDPQRFARHFGDAPVFTVSGRTWPVDVRYRPPVADAQGPGPADMTEAVLAAVDELRGEGPGDILVFLSGEREIADTAEALRRHLSRPHGPGGRALRDEHVEILPLFARLSAAEQHRVFAPHPGRRIVLATNVAETSLTVPGIRYVVDTGLARISRYSRRLKVQRLPIEPISQASADQRAGRCGRLGPGICIRLYGEEDLAARPRFTDPEILRTNLASVILAMADLGLPDLTTFPFLDPPDRRSLRDGVGLLVELGALAPRGQGDGSAAPAAAGPGGHHVLTPTGRALARLPVDPRLGRMILEADRLGCLQEVLVIAAALSIQDPRERPADRRGAADEAHRRFADPSSDFLSYWRLWEYLRSQAQARSSSSFRRLCTAEFIHYLRVREWQELVAELRRAARDLTLGVNTTAAHPDLVHRALLAGLLSHIGLWDPARREYLGARGARFALWPGSSLARRPPRWVVVGELVETSRLWGRTAARIAPDWVEPLARHLVTRTYAEPRWDRRRGGAVADERVSLYGLTVVDGRPVDYARVDPAGARELFIRHALVAGEWETHHRFAAHNAAEVARIAELEHKARQKLPVDEEQVFAFYDTRVPSTVTGARGFDAWWKRERRARPELLDLHAEDLLGAEGVDLAERAGPERFPDTWTGQGVRLRLSYRFDPGADDDGLTVHVPLTVLARLRREGFDWLVPGRRAELVTALLRTLPKSARRALVPLADTAAALVAILPGAPDGRPLPVAVADAAATLGLPLRAEDLDPDAVPDHLRPTFAVEDASGRELARGKDLGELAARFAQRARSAVAQVGWGLERSGLRDWPETGVPAEVRRVVDGVEVVGFPALTDEGSTVGVAVLAAADAARAATRRGVRRLLLTRMPSPARAILAGLPQSTKLSLARATGGGTAVLDDCLAAALDLLVDRHGGVPTDAEGFHALEVAVRADLVPTVTDLVSRAAHVLSLADEVRADLERLRGAAFEGVVSDVQAQLAALTGPGFVNAAGATRLPDLERYLRAARRRVEQLPARLDTDRDHQRVVARVQRAYAELLADLPPGRHPQVGEVRWLIEELRVSLYAQALGTPVRVSEQRILRRIGELRAGARA
jgi:ATP-dependent helicase HrpA